MEKQPIDELFARVLGDTEIKPSDRAFARLQARQQERRLPVNWGYWAAAACLVLIGSFMWWTSQLTALAISGRSAIAGSKSAVGRLPGKEGEVVAQRQFSAAGNTFANKTRTLKRATRVRRAASEVQFQKVERPMLAHVQHEDTDVRITTESVLIPLPHSSGPTLPTIQQVPQEMPHTSGRTLIVTIEAPIAVSQPSLKETAHDEENTAPRGGMNALLQKVKRLKEGEPLTLNTNKTPHHGLGKLYDEVKESIKNSSVN